MKKKSVINLDEIKLYKVFYFIFNRKLFNFTDTY